MKDWKKAIEGFKKYFGPEFKRRVVMYSKKTNAFDCALPREVERKKASGWEVFEVPVENPIDSGEDQAVEATETPKKKRTKKA